MKILTNDQRTAKNHVQFSESYIAKFWIELNGVWKQDKIQYFSTKKDAHESVEKRWNSDFKDKNVTLISIIYE